MARSLAALSKAFVQDVRPRRTVGVDLQFVRDRARLGVLSVVQLESNRAASPLGADPLESTATSCVARLLDTEFEAVREKAERIEQGTQNRELLPTPFLPITTDRGANGWTCCVFHSLPSVRSFSTR